MKKFLIIVITAGLAGAIFFMYGFKNENRSPKKMLLQRIEELKKKAKKSEDKYQKNTQSADKVAKNYKNLGLKYLKNRNWTPAIKSLSKAIEYGDSSARVHHNLAIAYANRAKELYKKNDLVKAERHYRRALEIKKNMHDARYGLANLYFHLKKDNNRAIKELKYIMLRDRTYYDARFALGRIYYEMGKKSMSLSVYQDLMSDLQSAHQSSQITKMMRNCKNNIDTIHLQGIK